MSKTDKVLFSLTGAILVICGLGSLGWGIIGMVTL